MYRIDSGQFNKENKMLFQKENWFIFLDFGRFTPKGEYYPRLAHKCNLQDRKNCTKSESLYKYTCCIVILDNNMCRDCHATIPEVFSGFFNLTKWGYED